MNVTDLRIAFSMDTGSDGALWAEDHDGKDIGGWGHRPRTNIKGHPRTVYGLWLEEKVGKEKYLRERYYKLHGEWPTSNHFAPGYPREVLYEDYIYFLEAFVLKFKPEIVTNIISV